ncbi:membrane protein [Dactylosporangium fulvum]
MREAGSVWLASVFAACVLTVMSRIGDGKAVSAHTLFMAWGQYDWGWYQWIADDGYAARWGDGRIAAFFPLYPLLVRGFDVFVPGPSLYAALTVSALALLGAYLLLHRLAEREFGPTVARRASWCLAVFPTGFFLLSPYPSSLFLLLAVGAFAAMRSGRWWVAGALCALASGTRSAGLLLAVPFVFEYVRQRGWKLRLDALAVLLVPGGLLAYMTYTYLAEGDALAFMHAQKIWFRELHAPWFAVIESGKAVSRVPLSTGQVNVLGLGAVLFMLTLLVLSVVGPWKVRRDQFALPLLAFTQILFLICFPVMSQSNERLMSVARHVLEVFPMFLTLAVLARVELINRVYVFAGLTLQGCLLAFYLHGGWIA